jgi:hypothetical protein
MFKRSINEHWSARRNHLRSGFRRNHFGARIGALFHRPINENRGGRIWVWVSTAPTAIMARQGIAPGWEGSCSYSNQFRPDFRSEAIRPSQCKCSRDFQTRETRASFHYLCVNGKWTTALRTNIGTKSLSFSRSIYSR